MSRAHGYARYRLDGCRCYMCSFAVSEYEARRQRLIAYGRWQPFVPIETAREQVLTLAELGYGQRRIAELAGLSRHTIRDLAAGARQDPGRGNPPLTKIRASTAAAVLAVPLDPTRAAPGALVDAGMTWERIHALIALGYPRAWIAAQLGLKSRALQLGRERVTAAHAAAVLELYHRVGDRLGPSAKARDEGRRNGWAIPFERAVDGYDEPQRTAS